MYLWWDSEIQTFLRKDCLRGNRNGWRCAFFNSSSIFDLINLESLEAQQLVVPLRKLKNTSDTQVELLSINGHTYFSKVVDFSSRKIESRLKYCFWPTRGVWSSLHRKTSDRSRHLHTEASGCRRQIPPRSCSYVRPDYGSAG